MNEQVVTCRGCVNNSGHCGYYINEENYYKHGDNVCLLHYVATHPVSGQRYYKRCMVVNKNLDCPDFDRFLSHEEIKQKKKNEKREKKVKKKKKKKGKTLDVVNVLVFLIYLFKKKKKGQSQ